MTKRAEKAEAELADMKAYQPSMKKKLEEQLETLRAEVTAEWEQKLAEVQAQLDKALNETGAERGRALELAERLEQLQAELELEQGRIAELEDELYSATERPETADVWTMAAPETAEAEAEARDTTAEDAVAELKKRLEEQAASSGDAMGDLQEQMKAQASQLEAEMQEQASKFQAVLEEQAEEFRREKERRDAEFKEQQEELGRLGVEARNREEAYQLLAAKLEEAKATIASQERLALSMKGDNEGLHEELAALSQAMEEELEHRAKTEQVFTTQKAELQKALKLAIGQCRTASEEFKKMRGGMREKMALLKTTQEELAMTQIELKNAQHENRVKGEDLLRKQEVLEGLEEQVIFERGRLQQESTLRKDAEQLLEQTDSDLAVTREKLGESLENAGALSQEVRALLEDKDGLEKDLGRVELALQVEEDRCRSALQHVDQGIRSRRSAQQKQEKMKEEMTLMKIEANHAKAEAEKVHVDIAAIRQELEDWKSECILLGKKLKHNAKKASADLQKAKDGEDAAVEAAKKAEADAEQARSEVELLKEMIQTLRLEARGRVLKKKQGLAAPTKDKDDDDDNERSLGPSTAALVTRCGCARRPTGLCGGATDCTQKRNEGPASRHEEGRGEGDDQEQALEGAAAGGAVLGLSGGVRRARELVVLDAHLEPFDGKVVETQAGILVREAGRVHSVAHNRGGQAHSAAQHLNARDGLLRDALAAELPHAARGRLLAEFEVGALGVDWPIATTAACPSVPAPAALRAAPTEVTTHRTRRPPCSPSTCTWWGHRRPRPPRPSCSTTGTYCSSSSR